MWPVLSECDLGPLPAPLQHFIPSTSALPGGPFPSSQSSQCLLCGFSSQVLQDSCFPAGLSSNIPSHGVLPGYLLAYWGCFLVTQRAQVLCGFHFLAELESLALSL